MALNTRATAEAYKRIPSALLPFIHLIESSIIPTLKRERKHAQNGKETHKRRFGDRSESIQADHRWNPHRECWC